MKDVTNPVSAWTKLFGVVLVVAVLYWAQAVLVPIALAMLLTFLLAPVTLWLQRWMGRVPAVLTLTVIVFSVLGGALWGLGRELSSLANDLPGYRHNIRQKIADVRGAGAGGSVEKVQDTINDIQNELSQDKAAEARAPRPVVVSPPDPKGMWAVYKWLSPIVERLATAGLVIVLVIFMLLERQDLRDRLIRLVGYGHVALTTRAFDEAATRISRYLLMQSFINLTFGTGVAIGCWWIGVPYALLWGALAASLRFIPYVGPWVAAAAPLLVSLAAMPGWVRPLEVLALFLVLELTSNMILEPVLYAGAAGVSEVALLIAVAFWTWLWGPLGLLMATPLTVCLTVVAKHVPGLEFIATMMADEPSLSSDVGYYQRLLARDQMEAAELIERHVKSQPADTVYDALLLPALNYAERDRFADMLTAEEERAVVDATRELMDDVLRMSEGAVPSAPLGETGEPTVRVFGFAANSDGDELALRMLDALIRRSALAIEVAAVRMVSSELVQALRKGGYRAICIADLPPSAPSKTRYLVKKLRAAMPDLKIAVGRWAPASVGDESVQPLIEAGADHVGTTLVETRDYLRQLGEFLDRPTQTEGAARLQAL